MSEKKARVPSRTTLVKRLTCKVIDAEAALRTATVRLDFAEEHRKDALRDVADAKAELAALMGSTGLTGPTP